MYKLSHEKCIVCFIFLVMVAFLSCTGFRIDSSRSVVTLTDYHHHQSVNANTSVTNRGNEIIMPIIDQNKSENVKTTTTTTTKSGRMHRYRGMDSNRKKYAGRHRIRHFKHMRTTMVPTEQLYAQIPPAVYLLKPPEPTEAIVTRSQRSPNRNGIRQRNKSCQEQDISRKAYRADTVVLAKAESMSSNRVRYYSVSFRILNRYKAPKYAVEDTLRLTFLNDTKRINCESELRVSDAGVVKAQIEQSMKYYLFLNSHGNHNYTVLGMPVLWRADKSEKVNNVLKRVMENKFVPRLMDPILSVTDYRPQLRAKVRLVCKIRGFPIPVVTWKKNESSMHPNNNTRIKYVNRRRKSTLVIKSAREADSGRYYCIVEGVTGETKNAFADIKIDREECTGKHKEEFCYNGGKCYNITQLSSLHCVCPEGFSGERCRNKVPSNPSFQ